MVSISPRLRDSLEYEDPDETDPRLQWGFRSLTLESNEYQHYDEFSAERPMSASSDSSNARRNRRQRQHDDHFRSLRTYEYPTRADGHTFRLVIIKPGYGMQPIDCELVVDSAKAPRHRYKCLSYCWQTTDRDAEIKCDGFKMEVTTNLWHALRSIRKPTTSQTIWIDQICINQDDIEERAQQVSIMKHIFNHAKQTLVWLGEEADNSSNLCEYAKKMRPRDGMRSSLSRILTPRQLVQAIAKLIDRPWFQRIWVIPEVCLAPSIRIVVGNSTMTWENLIRLIRDVPTPQSSGFAKQIVLPGNTRQRINILSQMITQQKESRPHTDVTQLLILAKSSQATDLRDLVYAFYGMTIVNTAPDYKRRVETLYIDIAHNYINNIEAFYDGWRDLTDTQRTFQLMSILYSAGSLHQQHELPSWVPDWSVPWILAPIWCKSASTAVGLEQDDESQSIRGNFRAGGDDRKHFEIIQSNPTPRLRLSAILVDSIILVGEDTESMSDVLTNVIADDDDHISSAVNYMRVIYRTSEGLIGVATQGIKPGDVLAIFLGGDVPFLLRRSTTRAGGYKCFHLLCETMVSSSNIMFGDHVRAEWPLAEDIQLV